MGIIDERKVVIFYNENDQKLLIEENLDLEYKEKLETFIEKEEKIKKSGYCCLKIKRKRRKNIWLWHHEPEVSISVDLPKCRLLLGGA